MITRSIDQFGDGIDLLVVHKKTTEVYKRASRLFADLAQARGESRLSRLMTTLERTNLIIIDDWGPEPLTADLKAP